MDQICARTTNYEDVATKVTTTNIMTDFFDSVTPPPPLPLSDIVARMMNDGNDIKSIHNKNDDDDEWWNPDLLQNPQSVFGCCTDVATTTTTTVPKGNVGTSCCTTGTNSSMIPSSSINLSNIWMIRRTIPKTMKRIQDCYIINLDLDVQQGEDSCINDNDNNNNTNNDNNIDYYDFNTTQPQPQQVFNDNDDFKIINNGTSNTPSTCFTSNQSQDDILSTSSTMDTSWPYDKDVVWDVNSPCKWYKRKRQHMGDLQRPQQQQQLHCNWKQTEPQVSAKITRTENDTTTNTTSLSTTLSFNIMPTRILDPNTCNIDYDTSEGNLINDSINNENCSNIGMEWSLLSLPHTNTGSTTYSPSISHNTIIPTTPPAYVRKNKYKCNNIQLQINNTSPISNKIHNETPSLSIPNDTDKILDNNNRIDGHHGLFPVDSTMQVMEIDHCEIPDSKDHTDDIDLTDDSNNEVTLYDDDNHHESESFITNNNLCHIIQQKGTINEHDLLERTNRKQFNRLMYEQIRGITSTSKAIL
jgi:hypothetical protein